MIRFQTASSKAVRSGRNSLVPASKAEGVQSALEPQGPSIPEESHMTVDWKKWPMPVEKYIFTGFF